MVDSRSLWPDDITYRAVPTPIVVLREQAALLGPMTKNILQADVWTRASEDGTRIVHTFALVAPALDNYTYPLFDASHDPVRVYPVLLAPADEQPWEVSDEEGLRRSLGLILRSPRTRDAIVALLAQSQAVAV